MLKCSKVKKKRDPNSAATSNFVLIVVVKVTLTKHSEVIFNLLKQFLSESAVLKCRIAPYVYQLTFAVHKVNIAVNFISFIDDVISSHSLPEALCFPSQLHFY